ncbi:MAG TPA: tetratricopeptide repeat protein [Bryobacteraceae bacterium]|jgi:HEAT repeat protein
MTAFRSLLLAGALAGAGFAQDPQPAPAPKQPTQPMRPEPPRPPKFRIDRDHGRSGDAHYDQGTRALDAGHWDEARQIFEAIAAGKGARADGALYWKAYAENRLGRRDDALATLASLRQQYPSSDWLNDAQALTVEIQQAAGKPVDPNAEANEDIKMMALNAMIGTDPERAIPLLERILKSSASPRLKDQALFVLSQSKSPQAQQLLLSIAKGGGSNPDLQLRALRNMAMSGNKTVSPEILSIYNSSHNPAIKKQAISSLAMAKASDELFNIARNEQDTTLRNSAIESLAMLRQADKLQQLYQAGIAKKNILESMFLFGDPARLMEIIRTEKDPDLRRSAIHSLGLMHNDQAGNDLTGLYPNEQDIVTKKTIVDALFIQRNAKGLVDIARKETNPEMKKEIVSRLTMMKSKDATDYLMELLK